MARMHRWLGLALCGLLLTGCVTQEKYNAMKLDRDRAQEQLNQAQLDLAAANAALEAYKANFGSLQGGMTDSAAMIKNLTQQNADLQRQLDDALNRLKAALANGATMALPQELTNTLETFAAQYPDLVEFDSKTGIVKFKSDVTFESGAAVLKPEAKAAIDKFATILNSPGAASYKLLVAGHTDNVRVSNPATINAGHKDNWYLSAHRAISVGQEMLSQRVAAERIGVVGYGEYHPVAPNTTAAGRAQNRRVEVLILPTSIGGTSAAPASATPAAAPKAPALNKDGMAAPTETPTPAEPGLSK